MKLKLLFVPLTILFSLYLIIWVIVPLYNGPDGISISKKKLISANDKLVDINAKGENALKLANDLNYNSEQQSILRQYLPDAKQDEEIINSLSSLASGGGLLLTNISLKDVAKEVAPNNATLDAGLLSDGLTAAVPTESLAKDINVDLEISGDYASIKKFIVALSALKRFNSVSALEIKRNASAESNALVAKMTIAFNYLNKITSVANVDNKIFADGKFDMNVAEDIKKKTSVDVSKVSLGSLGKTNPFAL